MRYTSGGRGVASFGLAVNRRWQDRTTNEWQEETSFFDCICWGDLGENCAASLPKGSRVVVQGRLQQRSWETDDGSKRSKVEVICDDVGASLRWATMQIERIARDKPTAGYDPAGYGPPSGSPEDPFIRDADITDGYL